MDLQACFVRTVSQAHSLTPGLPCGKIVIFFPFTRLLLGLQLDMSLYAPRLEMQLHQALSSGVGTDPIASE